jgi:antitoxin CcdA
MRMPATKQKPVRKSHSSQEPRRRPVNLSIRDDVMRAAKARGINASQVAERAIMEAVQREAAADWLRENADAIRAHNDRVERLGMFNEGLRRF